VANSWTGQASSRPCTTHGPARYEQLLVFKVDRLARSTGWRARVLEELDAAGVAFRSAPSRSTPPPPPAA
jgi:hypothetical protein